MTVRQAARKVAAVRIEIRRECQKAVTRTMRDAQARAKKWSSGGFSPRTLAKMDHPYATRHGAEGSGVLDPGKINAQTGEFREAWQTSTPSPSSGSVSGRLSNFDPKADFLQYGTHLMVVRPIKERLELYIFDSASFELAKVVQGLERVYG